jgi:hypothetical protein
MKPDAYAYEQPKDYDQASHHEQDHEEPEVDAYRIMPSPLHKVLVKWSPRESSLVT